jgi:hypothetical protein
MAQGVRYTMSEPARREVLARLLELNHQRYEEEQRMKDEGGRMKGRGKKQDAGGKKQENRKAKGKKAGKEQLGLF